MAIVERVARNKEKAKYRATFLRGRKEQSHITVLEIIEAEDAEKAVEAALEIATKAKWHLEKVERINEL